MTLYALVPDLWAFTQASWLIEKPYSSGEVFVIDDGMFSLFYRMLSLLEKDIIDAEKKGEDRPPLKALDLIKQVRRAFDLESKMISALYGFIPSSGSN